MVDTDPIARHRMRYDRLRDRLFIVLTANVALLWAWGAWGVSQEYVLTPNSARFLLAMLMPASEADSGSAITTTPNALPEETPRERRQRIERQIGTVEVIIYVWRRVMLGVVVVLELAALLSALTRWYRPLHLTAAVVMLLATVGTMVALRLLMSPAYGGMAPLAWQTHAYVAGAQLAYPILLLLAFGPKPIRSR